MASETLNYRESFNEQRIPCSLETFRVRAGLFLVVAWTLAVFSNFYINSRYVADVFAIYLLLWFDIRCLIIYYYILYIYIYIYILHSPLKDYTKTHK